MVEGSPEPRVMQIKKIDNVFFVRINTVCIIYINGFSIASKGLMLSEVVMMLLRTVLILCIINTAV